MFCTDMFDQVLKFGSYIVDALREYKQPILVYIPPYAELRGGAWVVLDPTINARYMEMYADEESRSVRHLYIISVCIHAHHRGGSRIFQKGGGVHLRSTSKKKGRGPGGGPTLGPMLKSLHSGQKGGSGPPGPPLDPPMNIRTYLCMKVLISNKSTIPYTHLYETNLNIKVMAR